MDLRRHLVLVPDTPAMYQAVRSLVDAAGPYNQVRHPWQPPESTRVDEWIANRKWKPPATELTPLEASVRLGEGATQIAAMLEQRAIRNLRGYQPSRGVKDGRIGS